MAEAKDIDAIDDILEMAQAIASLGVSSKGLRTLDEMKTRVKETLRISEKKKSSWTAKKVRLSRQFLNQSNLTSDFVICQRSGTISLVHKIVINQSLTDNVLKQLRCI